jgi:hypothetical protein
LFSGQTLDRASWPNPDLPGARRREPNTFGIDAVEEP